MAEKSRNQINKNVGIFVDETSGVSSITGEMLPFESGGHVMTRKDYINNLAFGFVSDF